MELRLAGLAAYKTLKVHGGQTLTGRRRNKLHRALLEARSLQKPSFAAAVPHCLFCALCPWAWPPGRRRRHPPRSDARPRLGGPPARPCAGGGAFRVSSDPVHRARARASFSRRCGGSRQLPLCLRPGTLGPERARGLAEAARLMICRLRL